MVVDRAAVAGTGTGNGEGGAAYLLPPPSALASLSHTYFPERHTSEQLMMLVKSKTLQCYAQGENVVVMCMLVSDVTEV